MHEGAIGKCGTSGGSHRCCCRDGSWPEGASLQTVDVLLIVLTLAVDNSGQSLVTVTAVDQERELQRLVAIMRFSEGLDASSVAPSIQQTTAYRHESHMLAYVFGSLQRAGLTEITDEAAKYPILAAINLVNCIATTKRLRSRS